MAESCAATAVPKSVGPLARVTIRPVATESSSAGIWETRPSPIDRRLYLASASVTDRCWDSTPIAKPPTRLISVMMIAAMASPLTNFVAPSIEP